MATLGFKDNDGLDVGNKYVTKEYIIDRYPNIATHSNMPSLWTWGGNPNGSYGFLGDNTATAKRSSPGSVFAGASNWRVVDCSGSSVIANIAASSLTAGQGSMLYITGDDYISLSAEL